MTVNPRTTSERVIQELRVLPNDLDPRAEDVLSEIKGTLSIKSIDSVKMVRVYRLQGIDETEVKNLADNLLSEALSNYYVINGQILNDAAKKTEVAYRPGVMNPEAASILKAAKDLGINNLEAVDSSWEYHFYGTPNDKDIDTILDRLLRNKTVEVVLSEPPKTLTIEGKSPASKLVPILDLSDDQLEKLSKEGQFFLNLEEMKVIQDYYHSINREPTDVELETLAQTWSEHCGHKTFKAKLIVDGKEKMPLIKRLMQATKKYDDNVISAFVDNAGVMRLTEGWGLSGKVETHNSPSAIEPYGGAATGSGGVFRDIIGTGQGAKVIVSTDMFCFAPPDLSDGELPPGCLHPRYLLRRVVAGVRDYGNRMGIPTNNGSIHFHPDFKAKPSVIVGAYGLIPEERAQKGTPQTGDLIIAIGGRTGRDGIHGATFSSGEMTADTISVNSSAVQIGNAIEEKRTTDAILAARDAGLIRAITDCGAGGFSSAVGEMGEEAGVLINLEKAPLKYPGLAPWEIWISESQERMVIAIDPKDEQEFFAICGKLNVEASVIGRFTGKKNLTVMYEDDVVCDLPMSFLHDGLPQRVMSASWKKPTFGKAVLPTVTDWEATYRSVMANYNVCSKEPIVRLYDHGVQGTSNLPPFTGVNGDAPNNSSIVTPFLDKYIGAVVGHGLNPVLNKIDPYWGSVWAAAEALSNVVAVGADYRKLGLIDNFIWPFPDEDSLGALDMSLDACIDVSDTFKIPFVSGKDSLSSTYRYPDGTLLKIPPVLCVSAFGPIEDVRRTVSSDLKSKGSVLALVGKLDVGALGGSVFVGTKDYGGKLPKVDLAGLPILFQALHAAIVNGDVLSCHDISEGGMAAALAEMSFGGGVGVDISLDSFGDVHPEEVLFSETAGCFIIEMASEADIKKHFAGIPYVVIGTSTSEQSVSVSRNGKNIFSVSLQSLKSAWQQPMKEIFH